MLAYAEPRSLGHFACVLECVADTDDRPSQQRTVRCRSAAFPRSSVVEEASSAAGYRTTDRASAKTSLAHRRFPPPPPLATPADELPPAENGDRRSVCAPRNAEAAI